MARKVVATVSTFLLPDTIDRIEEVILRDVCANDPVKIHRIERIKNTVTFEVDGYNTDRRRSGRTGPGLTSGRCRAGASPRVEAAPPSIVKENHGTD